MGTPALQEAVPDGVQNASVTVNEAACRYYLLTASRMHRDAAQPAGWDVVRRYD